MKVILISCFIICTAFRGIAQSDAFPTDDGVITMTPVLHATLVLEWKDRTIYIDPYGGAERFATFRKPNLVLITHAHGDHLNQETLAGLDLSAAELIAPQSVADDLGDIKFNKVTVITAGVGVARNGIRVEAVPMYNLPEDEAVCSRQFAVGSRQFAVGSSQSAVGSRQFAVGSRQ